MAEYEANPEQTSDAFDAAGLFVTAGTVERLRNEGWVITPPQPKYYASGSRVYSSDSRSGGYLVDCTSYALDNDKLAEDIAAYMNERYA